MLYISLLVFPQYSRLNPQVRNMIANVKKKNPFFLRIFFPIQIDIYWFQESKWF